jgi:suppressor for copper-sensitivity B
MFLLAFIGGLILNAMPCVLPVLSIKLLGLVQHGGQSRSVVTQSALASGAGILASFLALGAAAVLLKSAGHAVGWGTQFQNPYFVGALFVVVLLFALNLWGLFEIPMPRFIGQFATTYGYHETLSSHFMSGLFVTLLATPCSAPFLGTAMGFALAQSAPIILGIFAAAGFGMAVPYWALAVFPGTIRWMPRPGAWMGRMKLILGALLMATAFWLGWVWIHQVRPSTHGPVSLGGLAWVPFDEAALARYQAEGKTVFVDITADWCFTCKYNEKIVLSATAVKQAFADRQVILMQGDWTNRDAVISAFLQHHGRAGIPFAALYRLGREPILLPEFLTEKTVLDALTS